MARKGLSQQTIVDTAAALVEQQGLENITLRELADVLGVKTASLYNHLSGLDELNERLAELAVTRLDAVLRDAAVGRSGNEAVMELAIAYRNFARETPELYKAIISLPAMQDEQLNECGRAIMGIFHRVLEYYTLSSDMNLHFGRALRSALHGFVSFEQAGFFRNRQASVDDSFHQMVLLFLEMLKPYSPQ